MREGGDGLVNNMMMSSCVESYLVELETTLSHTSSNVVINYKQRATCTCFVCKGGAINSNLQSRPIGA